MLFGASGSVLMYDFLGFFNVSFAGHDMTVIEADGMSFLLGFNLQTFKVTLKVFLMSPTRCSLSLFFRHNVTVLW